ncbi:PREDICTED: protein YIPF1-like [Branchiostoma belcheri]|uniref:Protein YIPF n=1 Tax=Branchiostoma belcheri TaxID=7741 RepID=A0A6P5A7X8_BRABE|nr:PREDICTED: protein YIPF1-like [Branchiostoma belcheri]
MADPGRQTVVDVASQEKGDQISSDDLQFHDFSGATLSDGGGGLPGDRTSRMSSDDEPLLDADSDQAELLGGQKKQSPFWTFEYYQDFFDVDTYQVLHRILGSMLPRPGKNFLLTHVRPNPDIYGPFWVCLTLVFTTAISGNLANYFSVASSGSEYHWVYDFHKVTLAAAAIFSYAWLVPTALWGFLWWRNSQSHFTFLEIICVYGYSLSIYVPISVLWAIPVPAVQWALGLVGMLLSGSVLVMTFWPAVRDDERKVTYLTLVLIFILHGLLAVGFMLYFFSVPLQVGPVTPQPHRTTIAPGPAVPTTKP